MPEIKTPEEVVYKALPITIYEDLSAQIMLRKGLEHPIDPNSFVELHRYEVRVPTEVVYSILTTALPEGVTMMDYLTDRILTYCLEVHAAEGTVRI